MAEERAKILQMVAEGELTVEEADQLLDAISERARPGRAPVPPVPSTAPVPPVAASAPLPPGSEAWAAVEMMKTLGPMAAAAMGSRVAARLSQRPVAIRRRPGRIRANPTFDQLIQLSIHGISPDFVKQVRDAGLDDLAFDEVIQLGIHGVSPEYIKTIRSQFEDLTFDDIVQLAIHGVSPEFVVEVRGAGLDELTVEQVVQMAIHGVSVETVRDWKASGLGGLTDDEPVADEPEGDEPDQPDASDRPVEE